MMTTPITCPAPTRPSAGAAGWGSAAAAMTLYHPRSMYPSAAGIPFTTPRPTWWSVPRKPRGGQRAGAGWCYLLFDEEGILSYVGKTSEGPARRFSHHVREAHDGVLGKESWVPGVHHAVVIPTGSPEQLKRQLIAGHSPRSVREYASRRRDPENPSTLSEVLTALEEKGMLLRVDDRAPSWHTPVLGPRMTREERMERAAELRRDRLLYYAQAKLKSEREVRKRIIRHPDGHYSLPAAPITQTTL